MQGNSQGDPMQPEPKDSVQDENNGVQREDQPIPAASDDKVLDETARLAREGRKDLESDPQDRKPGAEV
jgi:hypothetical protein